MLLPSLWCWFPPTLQPHICTSLLSVGEGRSCGNQVHTSPAMSQLSHGAGSRCKSLFHEQLHSSPIWERVLPWLWSTAGMASTGSKRGAPCQSRRIFLAGTVAMESPGRSSCPWRAAAWERACTGALFPAACHRLILCAQCHDNNQWWQVAVGTVMFSVGTPVAFGKSLRDILKFKLGAFSLYLILLNYLIVFPSQRPGEPEQEQKMHKGLKVTLGFGYDALRILSALGAFGLACLHSFDTLNEI